MGRAYHISSTLSQLLLHLADLLLHNGAACYFRFGLRLLHSGFGRVLVIAFLALQAISETGDVVL
jgi:hypothetical protein